MGDWKWEKELYGLIVVGRTDEEAEYISMAGDIIREGLENLRRKLDEDPSLKKEHRLVTQAMPLYDTWFITFAYMDGVVRLVLVSVEMRGHEVKAGEIVQKCPAHVLKAMLRKEKRERFLYKTQNMSYLMHGNIENTMLDKAWQNRAKTDFKMLVNASKENCKKNKNRGDGKLTVEQLDDR